MLMNRIIKALTFKKDVYGEVEHDTSFTTTAWLIVVVVSIVAALGGLSFAHFGKSLIGVLIAAVMGVVGFAVAALVINLVGRTLFKAEVTFEELVRTMGLAYIWNAANVIGILGGALSCILAPVRIVAWVAMVISWYFAVREALDLDLVPTIVTVVLGWIVIFLASLVTGLILGALGMGGSALMGAFGG